MSKTPSKTPKNTKVTSKISIATLHAWNKWLAVIYALQGVAILLLSTVKTFPLTTNYLTVDDLASEAAGSQVLALATRNLADINIAYLIAAVLFVAALFHALAAWWSRKFYENDLGRNTNRLRWIQSAATASIMLVIVAMLVGVADLTSLIMIFVLSIVMSLAGLLAQLYSASNKGKSNYLALSVSCIAGITPWVATAIYLFGAGLFGGTTPSFVYGVYVSMLALFGLIAVGVCFQNKKKGMWADYLYGERLYLFLTLVAITALTWQVYFGALRP